jgi:hypothetical protein
MRARGFASLFVLSLLITVVGFVAPYADRWWPDLWLHVNEYWLQKYHHNLINPFASLPFELTSIGILIVLTVIAFTTCGKRGLWLMMGMPFLLYDIFLIFLLELGCCDRVASWMTYCCGEFTVGFFFAHMQLFYAGFWVSVDIVIAVILRHHWGTSHTMRSGGASATRSMG